jgi:hypothetical protein
MPTNPLQLIPAATRATIYVTALIIGVTTPVILPILPVTGQHILQAIAAVAALFASTQGLSNLTPDEDNSAIRAWCDPDNPDAQTNTG